jgi:L-ascorbate oxidase
MIRLLFYIVLLILIVQAYDQRLSTTSNGALRVYEFNITQQSINPDCSHYTAPVFLINNQLPGPAITANQGDHIRVIVRNQLEAIPTYLNRTSPANRYQGNGSPHPHDVALHFHGIRQYGSVQADGVPFLTQLPVSPGEEYVHEFRVVNQAGTYFYHGHVGLQEETVFGPLIIYESPEARPENLDSLQEIFTPTKKLRAEGYEYDSERTIMLSEYWHRARLEFEAHIMGPEFEFLPEADSVLINGRALFDHDTAVTKKCDGYETIIVQPGKTYRLRVIGATTFRTLGMGIANHKLTIIEVDGEFVKPYDVDILEVAAGQRFSVLLHTNQDVGDYGIKVARRWSDNVPRSTNGLAVLRYYDPSQTDIKRENILDAPKNMPYLGTAEDEEPLWIWDNLESLHGVDPIVRKNASRTLKLRSVDKKLPDGRTRWFINDVAYSEESNNQSPILYDIVNRKRKLGSPIGTYASGYDPHLGTYPIDHYEIVDFVIQTTHIPGEPCRSHPWHTHGHSHWEIAHGKGEYDEERDGHIKNVASPILKDLTMVYPNIDPELSEGEREEGVAVGCGWSKIRILAVSDL